MAINVIERLLVPLEAIAPDRVRLHTDRDHSVYLVQQRDDGTYFRVSDSLLPAGAQSLLELIRAR